MALIHKNTYMSKGKIIQIAELDDIVINYLRKEKIVSQPLGEKQKENEMKGIFVMWL